MPERIARPEFPYLDGLRGASAMVVVFYHAFLYTGHTGDAKAAMPAWGAVIGLGYLGVAVFIVLSGYVLMLPVVTTNDLSLKGGVWRFIKRRSRRILPPYYAALVFALLLIAVFPVLQQPSNTAWDSKLPVTWPAIISHGLLVHDLNPDWILKINGPLWSVAVEWQIYFVMVLVLLPMWRRVRPELVLGGLLVLTIAPAVLSVGSFFHPWFLALFAAGMWSAQVTVRAAPPRFLGGTVVALGALIPVAIVANQYLRVPSGALAETTAGLFVAAALAWVGRREVAGRSVPIMRPFKTRPMLLLGLISYSVYLFHSPLLALTNLVTMPLGLEVVPQYLLLTFVGVPVAVGISWAMFWAIERHFLNSRQRHAKDELVSGAQRLEQDEPPSLTGQDPTADPSFTGDKTQG